MYKNIMKKINFNMEEIKLFDSFAGIGALHQSLKELGVPTKLVGISEIDIDAIISYASIHIDNFKDIPFDYPSDDEMRKVLINRNIGYDFKKNKSKIPRLNKNKLKSCFYDMYLFKLFLCINNFSVSFFLLLLSNVVIRVFSNIHLKSLGALYSLINTILSLLISLTQFQNLL